MPPRPAAQVLPARRATRLGSTAFGIAIAAELLLASGCARLLVRPPTTVTRDAAAIIAAGAARERRLTGLRLSLSVRATAGPPAARLASPAYLAIDGPERLRLQVLSPFGVTVLDLATDADTFVLTLPLRGESRNGRIDLGALAAGTTPEDERMIVALVLLFRPKMSGTSGTGDAQCRAAGPATVTCTIAPDLAAAITVDDALRPVREEYRGSTGEAILVAELGDYPTPAPDALPGRITISDGQGGPSLVVRVLRARRS